jgi:hypothetical protein
MQQLRIPAFAAALALAGVSASAQSLGDVARKEEARRKAVAKSGKVYTNDSVRGSDAAVSPAPAGPAAAVPAEVKPEEKPAEDAGPKKDEAYWRTRMGEARTGLERAQTFQEALQSRINGLSAEFAARDDPAQRSVISSNRQKAMAELERVKKEIADFTKQISDIEDEARKAGVPAGWLR